MVKMKSRNKRPKSRRKSSKGINLKQKIKSDHGKVVITMNGDVNGEPVHITQEMSQKEFDRLAEQSR